jgi:AcrR family transcriptional regulator
MGTVTASTERRLRADAQRNYDAIVAAAGRAFTESGTQASLDDIAVRAGVGNATLYRHFPTRESLLVAALRVKLAELAELADRFEASSEPAEALREWFFHLATHLRTWRGLPDSIAQALSDADSPLQTACQPLRESTDVLLARAQQAGGARPGLDPGEVFVIIAAISWAADVRGDSDADLRRVLDVVLTGLR